MGMRHTATSQALQGGVRRLDDGRRIRRITAINDDLELVELLADIFGEGFSVTRASAASINAIADTRPDLLIVGGSRSVNESVADWELVRLTRAHRDLRAVPILMFTTKSIDLDAVGRRMAEHGGVHLLAMPFSTEVLEGLVSRVLRPEVPTSAAVDLLEPAPWAS
jgi:DNA-binding response OmpR family regulator